MSGESFLDDMSTTPEERDPRMPVIREGDTVRANPDFDAGLVHREAVAADLERRRTSCGTSFILNFDPVSNVHQVQGERGEVARRSIARQLEDRFYNAFASQCPVDNPPPRDDLIGGLEIAICTREQPGFNNGEVYLWLRGVELKLDFVVKVLTALWQDLNETALVVEIDNEPYAVIFYGCGWRYY